MNITLPNPQTRRLEMVLCAFFALTVLSAGVIYVVDPAIYTQTFSLTTSPNDTHPFAATALLLVIAAFVSLLIVGVLRHWRWLFWLILLAFSASIIDIPVTILQLANVLPLTFPVWYSLFRMGVSIVEIAIAVWMIQILRHDGVWALGNTRENGRNRA